MSGVAIPVSARFSPARLWIVRPTVATVVPALVAVGDLIGVFGGFAVATGSLGFNAASYLKNTVDFLEMWDVVSGLIKGAVFGFLVATMGCFYGMHSGRGAMGVGRATKTAVEAAAVFILAANFVLTGVFFSV